ncbi:coat protein [ssRNA phage SRR6960803_13]|uniref:Coat protein n=1 Tax=ssRNA phage SRR6960803_13 TaxID=2786616 RepID=A0A8S5L480_9VIRU|nr:coat protein [ssRNA phage SRR6960803_13]DAD52331.1 TPA_asm: coat protein [ssRNA phage SRR6960803_13]
MPQMANIVVKNVANVDVTYVAASPSAGDKTPAVWRLNAASSIIGRRPTFTAMSRDNTAKTARSLFISMRFPVVVTENSVDRVAATIPLNLEVVLPTNIAVSNCLEAFTQFGNLISSSLIRSVAEEGYTPT